MLKHAIIVATALVALVPVAASAGEVQNRINNENARINAGVHDGQLTAGQYRRLDRTADHIQLQRNRDLRANDGHLTAGQFHQLNREENNLSTRIYHDRHS